MICEKETFAAKHGVKTDLTNEQSLFVFDLKLGVPDENVDCNAEKLTRLCTDIVNCVHRNVAKRDSRCYAACFVTQELLPGFWQELFRVRRRDFCAVVRWKGQRLKIH